MVSVLLCLGAYTPNESEDEYRLQSAKLSVIFFIKVVRNYLNFEQRTH